MAYTYSAQQKLYIKQQSGTGVPSTSFAGSDACAITSFDDNMVQDVLRGRDKDGTFSPILGALNAKTVNWSTVMDLRPSGTAGTPPDCKLLMKSALGLETVNAGTSVVYTPHDSNEYYLSMLNGEGNTSIDYSQIWDAVCGGFTIRADEGLAAIEFNGQAVGYVSSKTFASLSSADKGTVTPLSSMPAIPSTSTINGTPPAARTGTITVGGQTINVLFRTANVAFSSGKRMDGPGWGSALSRGVLRGRRSLSVTISIVDDDSSAMTTILQNAITGTPMAVSIQIGSVAGLRCTVAMPKVLFGNPPKDYSNDNRGRTLTGDGNPSSAGANDEITVTWS